MIYFYAAYAKKFIIFLLDLMYKTEFFVFLLQNNSQLIISIDDFNVINHKKIFLFILGLLIEDLSFFSKFL